MAREAGWSRWYRAACAVLFVSSLGLLVTGLVAIGLMTADPGGAGSMTASDRSARYLSVVLSLAEGLLCLCAGSLCATAAYHREGGWSLGNTPRRTPRVAMPAAPRIVAVAICAAMSAVHGVLMLVGAASVWPSTIMALCLQVALIVGAARASRMR